MNEGQFLRSSARFYDSWSYSQLLAHKHRFSGAQVIPANASASAFTHMCSGYALKRHSYRFLRFSYLLLIESCKSQCNTEGTA
jgi:hypothetical protein